MPAHDPVPASVAGVVDEQAAQAIAEEAFARGVEEGTRQAESAYAVELKRRLIEEREQATSSAAGRLERIGDKLQAQIGDVQVRAEEAVVRLALSIAEQVVKREVRMNNTLVIQQIREALHRVVGVEHIKIRVNPADEAVVREHRTAVLSGSDAVRELVIEPDPKIEAGGCILESDSGNVDARLSTQLKKIESMFLEQNVVS
jgi:flagellar assembly protein FliH